MIAVLTIDSERKSAERLGFSIPQFMGPVTSYDRSVIIRWGNSSPMYDRNDKPVEFKNVVNPREAIRLNCRKAQALENMSKVVHTPRMWQEGQKVPVQQMVVYRHIEHSGGDGFKVDIGPIKVNRGYYATQWLDTDREVRVWFVGDKTMCAKRVPLKPSNSLYPCRSQWGYSFYNKVPVRLHDATLRAANAIGLECGAADVLYYENKWYFLELNSAATIDKQVIEDFYVDGLYTFMHKKFPELV